MINCILNESTAAVRHTCTHTHAPSTQSRRHTYACEHTHTHTPTQERDTSWPAEPRVQMFACQACMVRVSVPLHMTQGERERESDDAGREATMHGSRALLSRLLDCAGITLLCITFAGEDRVRRRDPRSKAETSHLFRLITVMHTVSHKRTFNLHSLLSWTVATILSHHHLPSWHSATSLSLSLTILLLFLSASSLFTHMHPLSLSSTRFRV